MPTIVLTDGDTSVIVPNEGDAIISPRNVSFEGAIVGSASDLEIDVLGQFGDLATDGPGIVLSGSDIDLFVGVHGVIEANGIDSFTPFTREAVPVLVSGENFTFENRGLIDFSPMFDNVSNMSAVEAFGFGADLTNRGVILGGNFGMTLIAFPDLGALDGQI